MRPLAGALALLLLSALLPSVSAIAADPCGRAPLRACAPGEAPSDGPSSTNNPTGGPVCPPGTPAGQPCATGPANGKPQNSGFTSKYPSDRSVDIFKDSQPPKGSFTDKNYPYYGVTFDSSMLNQSVPFIKVENRRTDGNRDEYLCTSIDDPACSAEKNWQVIFIEGGIGNCATNPGTACVESFSVITAEGKEVIAKPLMKFPKNAKEFPGKINPDGTGYAAGLASWIWRAEGDGPGDEHDYLLTGNVQSAGENKNKSWKDLQSREFFFEAVPIFRENSTLIKAPEKIMQKKVGRDFSEIMTSNNESGCYANDDGVCLHRREFQPNTRLKIILQMPKFVSGWLNGRLNKPAVTSKSFSTTSDQITVEAGPEENIFAGKWMNRSDIKDFSFKNSQIENRFKGMFQGYYNKDNPQSLRDSGEDGAMDAYDLWAPYMGENAFAINKTWTLSNARSDNPSNCVKKGVGGIQGVVTTNASAYEATAPKYNKENGTLEYRVAAPHFAPDGKTENIGTYGLAMSVTLLQCLYGITNVPTSASVSITTSAGVERISTVALRQLGNWVFLSAENFTYSSPTLRIKLNQTSSATTQSTGTAEVKKESPAPEVKEVKEVAAAKPAAATAKKITVTCTKGKLIKKLSGTNPKCPSGFKKK
jgi:hypothetical protein